jgi:hypothetical protein
VKKMRPAALNPKENSTIPVGLRLRGNQSRYRSNGKENIFLPIPTNKPPKLWAVKRANCCYFD